MLSPATRITLSTLRLRCGNGNQLISQGTGFLFNFRIAPDAVQSVPVIVTNKHVVGAFDCMVTTVSTIPARDALRENCTADGMEHHEVRFENLQNHIINHPDPNIDLCAITCAPMVEHFTQGRSLRHMFLDESWLPDETCRTLMRPVERTLMVGYPNGLWDETLNLPIVRDGLTGSHPLNNWNGRQEFVIDVACFPGSSGSPVFQYEDGIYRSGAGSYSPGTRLNLIGVLWGGPSLTVEGRLEQRPIPTGAGEVPVFNAMMNLGYAVRIDALLEIKRLLLV